MAINSDGFPFLCVTVATIQNCFAPFSIFCVVPSKASPLGRSCQVYQASQTWLAGAAHFASTFLYLFFHSSSCLFLLSNPLYFSSAARCRDSLLLLPCQPADSSRALLGVCSSLFAHRFVCVPGDGESPLFHVAIVSADSEHLLRSLMVTTTRTNKKPFLQPSKNESKKTTNKPYFSLV